MQLRKMASDDKLFAEWFMGFDWLTCGFASAWALFFMADEMYRLTLGKTL